MLFLIGLGLGDEKDITLKGLEAIKKSKLVFLETYTSPFLGSLKRLEKISFFAIGYGQTWQALSLAVPKQNYFAEYDIDIFKGVYLAVEYRHDVNYSSTDVATNSLPFTGKHKNTVTGKIYVNF